jgi:cyclophilin family peptidyl-prolyl cis-trans isomerase
MVKVLGILVVVGVAVALWYYKPWSPSDAPIEGVSQPIEDPRVQDFMKLETNQSPDLTPDAQGMSKATAIIVTKKGIMKFKFFPNEAPATVKRIAELINKGFYNGLTFHRVVEGFVIQGGDPQGNGTGGSGQRIKAEFSKLRHQEGTVAMARAADPNSADSQFYIAFGPAPHLDGQYTVFGQVVEGLDVIRKIRIGDEMLKVLIQ